MRPERGDAELPAPRRPLHRDPALLALVAVGGVAGTATRDLAAAAVEAAPGGIPVAVTTVNLLGSLAIGLVLARLLRAPADATAVRLRALIVAGFLGGLTTYSTLAVEVVHGLRDGRPGAAVVLGLGSVVFGALAALVGLSLGNRGRRR